MALSRKEKAQRREDSIQALHQIWKSTILQGTSLLNVTIEYGSGMTDYVRVELFYINSEGKGAINDLSFHVGNACGYSFRRGGYSSQLALGGGNYSKTYDVALALFRVLDVSPDDVNFRYR